MIPFWNHHHTLSPPSPETRVGGAFHHILPPPSLKTRDGGGVLHGFAHLGQRQRQG